ncbi:unnamed protein product [Allacma fusca]|uniref:C2 domain-containing protein n=1 Tax=Allacma fusca TaxID=39272 RepID=A0A8J2JE33_9HEXA|nr:unnamed protein product [Allacma fusca]
MGDCEPWFYPGQKCDPYCKIYSKPVDSEQVLIAETASLSETNNGEFPGEYTCTSSNEQDMLLFEFYDDNWPWSSDYYGDCSFTVKEIVEGKPAIKNIESSMASGSTAIVTCTSATKPKSSDLE